jgi:hypothetical protein
MPANIITTDDLREFKTELIEQLKDAIGLSASTIHQLRIMRILPYTKVSGVIFYDWEDIVVMMQKNKKISKPKA